MRQNLKRIFAAAIAAAVALTIVPAVFAETLIDYDAYEKFESGDDSFVAPAVDDDVWDLFTCKTNGSGEKIGAWKTAYDEENDALAVSTNGANGYQTRFFLGFDVSLTEDNVVEYKVKADMNQYYLVTDVTGKAGYNGADAASKMAESVLHLKNKTAAYKIVVDADTKTISYYMDGEFKYSEVYSGDSITLYHQFYSDQSGTEKVRTNYIYYFLQYTVPEIPTLSLTNVSASKATVQFNTPIDATTLTKLSVNGSPVTAYKDISVEKEVANLYTISYSAAAGKVYTLTDGGLTGPKQGESSGELLNMPSVRVINDSYVPTAADKFEILDAGEYGVDVQLYDTNCKFSDITIDNGLSVVSGTNVSNLYGEENIYRLRFDHAAVAGITYTMSLDGVNRNFMLTNVETGLAFTAESSKKSESEMVVTISGYKDRYTGMQASIRLELDKNGRSEVYSQKVTLLKGGKTEVSIPITASGRYYVTVDALGQESVYTNDHLVLLNEDATSITTSINTATKGTEVLKLIQDNKLDEIFDFAPYNALPGTEENADAGKIAACDMLIKNRPEGGFALISDFYQAIKIASIAVCFTPAVTVEEDVLLGYTKDYDSLMGFSDWDNYTESYLKSNDSAFQKKAIGKIANYTINTYADIAKALAGGVVCVQIANAEHYTLIDGYLTGSDDLLKLDYSEYNDYKDAVQEKMLPLTEDDLKTYTDVIKAFEDAVDAAVKEAEEAEENEDEDDNYGGGFGGGGFASSGAYYGSGIATEKDLPEDDENASDLNQPVVVFSDLAGFEWATTYINELYKMNIISGKGDKVFAPADSITRAEFAKMMVGAFHLADATYDGFDDVKADDWYYPYVGAAYAAGLIQGTGDGRFGANDVISRQDAIVIAFRALNAEASDAELNFKDKDAIADYAISAVATLSKAGIISGNEHQEFLPNNNLNRAEAAKIIYTLLTKEVK